jgi:hypothetical protein
MARWQEVAKKVQEAADAIQFEPGSDFKKVVQLRVIETGAGNEGNAFTPMFFAMGDLRHIRNYLYFAILFAENNETFSLEQLKGVVRWAEQPAEFCAYCGFTEMNELTKEVMDCLDEVESKEELVELIRPLRVYASHMNQWSYHYFPYGIGYALPLQDEAYFEEGLHYARISSMEVHGE